LRPLKIEHKKVRMRGGALDGAIAIRWAGALTGLLGLVGCAGATGERSRSPATARASSVEIAPPALADGAVESVPASPLPTLPAPASTESAATASPQDASPVPSPEASPPAASNVSLIDERPCYRAHLEVDESPAAEHRHSKRHGHHRRPYHPAPGIIVDVAETQGGVAAADLQRAARNVGYWPFRRCYEEGLRRDQRLAGRVALELVIGPSGAVERTVTSSATLSDPSVVTCVAREALHLSLVPGDSPTETKMVVTLATGDEPVPVARPVPGADDLRQALRAQWPAVTQCYASELARHPDTGGRLELRFRVSASGEIAEVGEGDTHFCDADVTRCVVDVYRATKLPAIRGAAGDATFIYPMHLEPRSNVLPVGTDPTP
jgi:hypothetical protein